MATATQHCALGREFGQLDGVVRAKRHRYIPVVLSQAETEAILGELQPPYRLVGLLLYGCGLRLMECVNLRIQCFTEEFFRGKGKSGALNRRLAGRGPTALE